jgi:acetyl-CoA synthetase
MTRGFWLDPDRYVETYWSRFPGTWVHGDWAIVDGDGHWFIRGRSDDTLKVAGKRLGPAEVESLVNSVPGISESAAIGVPDPVKGEAVVVFARPDTGTDPDDLRAAIVAAVVAGLGKPLTPKAVLLADQLPRTRSGKILRRVIKAVHLGQQPGDMSSLDDIAALDAIKEAR